MEEISMSFGEMFFGALAVFMGLSLVVVGVAVLLFLVALVL
jgi:hypothetical protein